MATPVGEPHYFIRRSYRDLAEGELPGRSVLDRAAPDHPVFIQAWAPVVPNVCAMNTLALRPAGGLHPARPAARRRPAHRGRHRLGAEERLRAHRPAVDPRYAASGQKAATPGISREQALDMWTREAAHVLRWEGIGSLEPGSHADLAVIDQDPLTCPIDDLPGTQVITTLLSGQTVAGKDITGDR